jgi:hypothetical protein
MDVVYFRSGETLRVNKTTAAVAIFGFAFVLLAAQGTGDELDSISTASQISNTLT